MTSFAQGRNKRAKVLQVRIIPSSDCISNEVIPFVWGSGVPVLGRIWDRKKDGQGSGGRQREEREREKERERERERELMKELVGEKITT